MSRQAGRRVGASSKTRLGALLAVAICSGLGACTDEAPENSRIAQVNGTRLYYESEGEGDPIVLIHGFTLDSRLFDSQVGALGEGRRVVRYDARGFGRSAGIESMFSTSDDLKALFDELEIERAALLGVSMGGRYAIDFALSHPERVSALIVSDPGLSGQALPTIAAELAPALASAQAGNIEQAKRIWFGSSIFAPAREQPAVEAQLSRMIDDYSGWHFVHGLAADEVPLNPPGAQRLSEISVPTLALMGERDVSDIRVIIDKLAAEVPGARAQTFRGVGHFPNLEAPEAFNRAVLDFLATARR